MLSQEKSRLVILTLEGSEPEEKMFRDASCVSMTKHWLVIPTLEGSEPEEKMFRDALPRKIPACHPDSGRI